MASERDWQNETSHERVLRRLEACSYTAAIALLEISDPEDVESRADLLLAAEALFIESMKILSVARMLAWGSSDAESERL